MRQRCGMASVDLKSCYDRMVHAPTAMSMRRCGCPDEIIESSFSNIQNLKHHLRTKYGDSVKYFEANKERTPVHGVGQGNGGGPSEWAVVSTPIFNSMRKRGYGIYLCNPITQGEYQFVGYAFVDDTDLVIGDVPGEKALTSLIPHWGRECTQ